MNMPSYMKCLWNEIQMELTARHPMWRSEIFGFGQVGAVSLRACGKPFSDLEVFYGFVLGLLSNNTNWSKVQGVLGQPGALAQLNRLFCGYDPVHFSTMPSSHMSTINSWFISHRAGAMVLHKSLQGLHKTSSILTSVIGRPVTLDGHFISLKGSSPSRCLACKLGSSDSTDKLPGFGIPLAAESLKNIGYDVAKPDRHINRALGSFGLVDFKKWPVKGAWSAPLATEQEFRKVMWVMDHFAKTVGVPTVYVDNAIWILCASGGRPHLSNSELRNIAARCTLDGSGPFQGQFSSVSSGREDPFDELDFDEFPCDNCRRRKAD